MKKNKINNKILLIVLTIVLIFATSYIIVNTFAIYEESVTTKAGERLAKWDITINNTTMGTNTNTFALSSLSWTPSSRVKEGKVAPGMSGSFTIEIDPGDTEVSIKYDITLDKSQLTNTAFTITSIRETSLGGLVRTGENTYSGIITLREIGLGYTHQIVVNLAWANDDYNNDADTEWGKVPNNTIAIPVTVHLEQYDGTALTPYVPPVTPEPEEPEEPQEP
jgi:hypothetical protein